MFCGTLGTWNNTPIDLELNDNEKPVFSLPCPVLRVNKAVLKKQVERLVSLGVLKHANYSEWVAPSFVQPKAKMNRVRLLSELLN